MRILFVINALNIGGAETFLMRLIKELSSQGHKTFLYIRDSSYNNPDFADYFIKESGVTFIDNIKKPSKLKNYICYKIDFLLKSLGFSVFYENHLFNRTVRFIQREIIKYDIDIINSHLAGGDFFAVRYLKPVLNKPLIITMQGCYDSLFNVVSEKIVAEAVKTIGNCDGMTHVADKNLEFFKQTNTPVPKIIEKIYNGLAVPDISLFKKRKVLGLNDKDFVVGQVSRSMESKGMEIAIRSVIHLFETKEYHNIKLVLVGPENDYYFKLKSKYSEKPYVFFPGETNNSIEWCGMFDVGILPTYFPSESCPSSIIEYLACGKPVISTTIGEISNMVDAGGEQAGILVGEKDKNGLPKEEEFINAIEKLYVDKDYYKKLEALTKKAFEKFNILNISRQYLSVYEMVIKNNNSKV